MLGILTRGLQNGQGDSGILEKFFSSAFWPYMWPTHLLRASCAKERAATHRWFLSLLPVHAKFRWGSQLSAVNDWSVDAYESVTSTCLALPPRGTMDERPHLADGTISPAFIRKHPRLLGRKHWTSWGVDVGNIIKWFIFQLLHHEFLLNTWG